MAESGNLNTARLLIDTMCINSFCFFFNLDICVCVSMSQSFQTIDKFQHCYLPDGKLKYFMLVNRI